MADFLQRLKQRKLVQWAIAYVAFAFALIQVLDVVSDSYGWPHSVMHIVFGLLVLGFVVMVILAWYHGERGAQRLSGVELLLIALVLVVGGGLLWHFTRSGSAASVMPQTATARSPDSAQRNPGNGAKRYPGNTIPTSATAATKSPDPAAEAAGSGLRTANTPLAAQPIPAKSVAVLPFENLSADKNNAYFADGMQDLILTKLADIGDLKVISRTSTLQYGSHPQNLTLVGKQLGVATILEGSVQKAGNQVLINVQLIDAKTDSHIWAQSYQRTLDNIFGVEGEVATEVAKALNAKLTAAESEHIAAVPTRNPAAYDAFLKGEYYLGQGFANLSPTDYHTSFDYYRKAVADDPEFALAWAHLATGQMLYIAFIGNDVPGIVTQAKAAMDRALSLQPNLAPAHIAQGLYRLFVQHDIAGAADAFTTAHALKPQDWIPIFFGGLIQEYEQHPNAAIEAFHQASTINPRTAIPFDEMAGVYERERRYKKAQDILKHALAIDPSSLQVIRDLANTYALTGDLDAMQAVLDATPASVKANPVFMQSRAQYFVYRRDWNAARTALLKAQAAASTPGWRIECLLGDVDRLAGNPAKARPYYQQCAKLLQAAIHHSINGQAFLGNLGLALLHLRQTKKALAQGKRGITEHPSSASAQWLMAQIQAQAGQPEAAAAKLGRLFSMPGAGWLVSVPLLELDPIWDPIRDDPAFQALLEKYSATSPVNTSSAP